MMRILFLCNKLPYPSKEGGAMAMNMMIEGMLKAGHIVNVLAVNSNKYFFAPDEIPLDYKKRTELETVYIDLSPRPLPALYCLLTNKSYHVYRFISNNFKLKLKEILQNHEFDIIQLETIFLTPYLDTIRQFSSAKIILRAHNIESLIWKRLARNTQNTIKKFYLNHLAKKLKAYEKEYIQSFDGIICISQPDSHYYQTLTNHKIAIRTAAFGLNIKEYDSLILNEEPPSLFFIGALNWLPNAEGLKWFLSQIWPEIHKHYPALKFYIASKSIPLWLKHLASNQILLSDSVENAKEFIAKHSIMIVPLLSGSGIRIKIIEGMALGKAIISTSIGAEGIECSNGVDILIANNKIEFIDSLGKCMANNHIIQQLGLHARSTIEERYNANEIIKGVDAFYQGLIKK